MALLLQKISVVDFRNYPRLVLDALGPLNIFIGANGIGKSNILEGIQLTTSATSFRGARAREMIRWGRESALLEARMTSSNRDITTKVALSFQGRSLFVNGKRKQSHDLQSILPSVVFSPEDMQLVKGGHGQRRDSLDALGAQLSRSHGILRRDYMKLVKHKNSLLKEGSASFLLDTVDQVLLSSAAHLYAYRTALFDKLAPRVVAAYESLAASGESLELRYLPSWEDESIALEEVFDDSMHPRSVEEASYILEEAMSVSRAAELRRGRSLIGPHADKVFLYIKGRNAALYASQGQQRSIALAWKIAEVALIEEMLGAKPILLLDDVASELDGSRREALVRLLQDDVQTFITTTDMGSFERSLSADARVMDIGIMLKGEAE